MRYADRRTKEFYQIGISANITGISIYLMGLDDRKYLAEKFKKSIGEATVTGYCIKFRKLQNVHLDVLLDAIQYGIAQTRT